MTSDRIPRYLNLLSDPQQGVIAECRIGLRSVPCLADHGFHDMVVLPGSFYVDMATLVHEEVYHRKPGLLRKIRFEHPAILTDEDTVIGIRAADRGDHRVEYSFFHAESERGTSQSETLDFARLEIGRDAAPEEPCPRCFPAVVRERAVSTLSAETFYRRLRENGNQYGPRFQNIAGIWISEGQVLAEVRLRDEPAEADLGARMPGLALMDSITQLLSAFVLERGRVFILRAIERITIHDASFPKTMWVHATLHPGAKDGDEAGFIGDLRVTDSEGALYLDLNGVAFAYLDRIEIADRKQPEIDVRIAATFTAEPMEDVLQFWGHHFDTHFRTEYSSHNQVFQQLLDPNSAFHRNGEGVNVLLVDLEDWAKPESRLTARVNPEHLEAWSRHHARCTLPNGLEIVHLNRHETDYLYREIFEDRCYLKHGIRLRDGDTVVDIGANIGLFTLFVLSQCKDPTVYAFEPSPVVYELLKTNCDLYGVNVRAFNVGVSDRVGDATFTFYDRSSVFSGFHSDGVEDREAIQAVVRNELRRRGGIDEASLESCVPELMKDRMRCRTYQCRMTSVSDIIRDHRIEKIDLLKIDAEKSEWDILQGIDDRDWPKIEQIVVEVHDPTGRTVGRVAEVLMDRGYRCAVGEEALLEHAGLYNVYGTRSRSRGVPHRTWQRGAGPSDEAPTEPESRRNMEARPERNGSHARADGLRRNVRDFIVALDSFMTHSTSPLILCLCPRAPATSRDPGWRRVLDDAERTVLSAARRLPNVRTIDPDALTRLYPVVDWFDTHSRQLAHIPYTTEGYTAIGTMLVRSLFGLKSRPFKVIVLDCDNTLWQGVCAEDGPLGVAVTGPYRALQEFMVSRVHAGTLICLCSKNNEQDVLDVFDRNPGMVLQREHLVARRVNWRSKPENIRSLADELNLSLDSFIFFDDNPVECAEVRARCPEVLTVQLPPRPESIPSFLKHVWAFDSRDKVTQEDRDRTRMYREDMQREALREQRLSLRAFIKSLQLRVEIGKPAKAQWSRVSQLTYRVSQFNLTSRRRSEAEIEGFLNHESSCCLAVRVADRFGDYGLVGTVLYETIGDRYRVDTLLLSCRVLGRGVEHRLLAELGRRAIRQGVKLVEFTCRPTDRNRPALAFMRDVARQRDTAVSDRFSRTESQCAVSAVRAHGAGSEVEPPTAGIESRVVVVTPTVESEPGADTWTFPAGFLADLEYDPAESLRKEANPEATSRPEKRRLDRSAAFGARLSEQMQRIAGEWVDVDRIVMEIEAFRQREKAIPTAADLPDGSLEGTLADIWRRILGRPAIGVNENFFEAGGTSLRAVQLVAAVTKELKRNVSIVNLFECPTVRLFAASLSETKDSPTGAAFSPAARRGRQRRSRFVRRSTR